MGITSSGLNTQNTFFDGEERHIESPSKIEDGNISLADDLFVESVSDSSSGGFVYDMEGVRARNSSSILGRLTLQVVEVRRVATSSGGGS